MTDFAIIWDMYSRIANDVACKAAQSASCFWCLRWRWKKGRQRHVSPVVKKATRTELRVLPLHVSLHGSCSKSAMRSVKFSCRRTRNRPFNRAATLALMHPVSLDSRQARKRSNRWIGVRSWCVSFWVSWCDLPEGQAGKAQGS